MTSTPPCTGRVWAYGGAALGGLVSVAANVAHSYVPPDKAPDDWAPEPGAVLGAVFWPVALFVAVEILARITWPTGRRWIVLRYAGLGPVAVVAAVVSYRHLSGLLTFYREDSLTATIGPLAVDGLMVMATAALIATAPGSATTTETGAEIPAPEVTPAALEPATGTGPVREEVRPRKRAPRRSGRPDTATAVARLRDRHPDLPVGEIAKRLGITDRTVRRHLAARAPATTHPDPSSLPARSDPPTPSTVAA